MAQAGPSRARTPAVCVGHRGRQQRIASIIFSRTTRRAMGVMHGHEAVIGSTLMCCDSNAVTGEDRFLGVLPNSHIYGLYVQVIAPPYFGRQRLLYREHGCRLSRRP